MRLVRPGTTRQLWDSRFSLALDGASKYLARAAGLAGWPQVFTVSAWVKPGADAALSYIFDLQGSGTRFRMMRRGDAAGKDLDVRFNTTTTRMLAQGSLTAGSWAHICATRDSSDVCRLYQDAVEGQVSGIVDATVFGSSSVAVGAAVAGASSFNGGISQFLLFDEVLPVADLYANPWRAWYKYPSCQLALNPGHVADSAASGGLIHDWHSRGQHFTPTNMVEGDKVADAP